MLYITTSNYPVLQIHLPTANTSKKDGLLTRAKGERDGSAQEKYQRIKCYLRWNPTAASEFPKLLQNGVWAKLNYFVPFYTVVRSR